MFMAADPPADSEALKSMAKIKNKEGIPLWATNAEHMEVKQSIINILGFVTSL
jgi:hypothetical protein